MTKENNSQAKEYYKLIKRHLRRQAATICTCTAFIALGIAILIYSSLHDTARPMALIGILAWLLLLGITGTTSAGFRFFNNRMLKRSVRQNMCNLFPDLKKDLDIWLAEELEGNMPEAARTIAGNRLDTFLPEAKKIQMPREYLPIYAALGLLMSLLALAYALHPLPVNFLINRYLLGLIFQPKPLSIRIDSFLPESAWVPRNSETPFKIKFSSEPKSGCLMEIKCGKSGTRMGLKTEGSVCRGTIPPQADDFSVQVQANRQPFAPRHFRLYPDTPLSLQSLTVLDSHGFTIRKNIKPSSFPVTVYTNSKLVFELAALACPMETFGFTSNLNGDIGLATSSNRSIFMATQVITNTDLFQIYWQYPGSTLQRSANYLVKCMPGPTPAIHIDSPANGTVYSEEPAEWKITLSGRDLPRDHNLYLFWTDCHDMEDELLLTVPLDKGILNSTVTLPNNLMADRQCTSLVLCAAAVDPAGKTPPVLSQTVEVFLPLKKKNDMTDTNTKKNSANKVKKSVLPDKPWEEKKQRLKMEGG